MAISIDFAEDFIKIIVAENCSNKIEIKSYFEINQKNNYIKNGYIQNKLDLTLELSKIINENNLKKQECFVNIRTTDSIAKDIILPKTNNKNLIKLIENQLTEIFSNDLSKFYIDFAITDEFMENKKSFYKITIYCLPKNLVDEYKVLISNIGLKPKNLSISRSFMKNVLKEYKINGNDLKNSNCVFIDLNKTTLSFSLISNAGTVYKRTINISDERKRENLFKENIFENKEYINQNLTNEQPDELTFLNDDFEEYDLKDAKFVSPIFLKIEEELYKIIQFSMSLNAIEKINKIFIYGSDENLNETVQYINDNLDMPCEKIQDISNLKFETNNFEKIELANFFICILNILRKWVK